jgi:murein DD-endopeptidase MepM/ murein hydrolase activator NlpD
MRFKEFKEAFQDMVGDDEDNGNSMLTSFLKLAGPAAGKNLKSLVKDNPAFKQFVPDQPDAPTNAIGFDKPSAANRGASPSAGAISPQPMKGGSKGEIRPVQGAVNSKFGANRGNRSHPGVDIQAVSGTPIKAPITGQITQAEMSSNDCGGTIAISDGNVQHRFCHCSKINVSVGQYVKQGAVVGLTGGGKGDAGRGRSSGPHLHWEKKLASGGLVNPIA